MSLRWQSSADTDIIHRLSSYQNHVEVETTKKWWHTLVEFFKCMRIRIIGQNHFKTYIRQSLPRTSHVAKRRQIFSLEWFFLTKTMLYVLRRLRWMKLSRGKRLIHGPSAALLVQPERWAWNWDVGDWMTGQRWCKCPLNVSTQLNSRWKENPFFSPSSQIESSPLSTASLSYQSPTTPIATKNADPPQWRSSNNPPQFQIARGTRTLRKGPGRYEHLVRFGG